MSKPVILTGLRANNDLHLGNYLGALLPIVDMANQKAGEYQINLFVPDLHSFTTPIDHSKLQEQIRQNLRVFVAAGLNLDNPDINIYRQSYIPAHSELAIILNCFTGFGELSRMTQFKEKSLLSSFTETEVYSLLEEVLSSAQNIELIREHRLPDGKVSDLTIRTAEGEVHVELKSSRQQVATVGLFDYPVLMAADILLYNATYVPVGDDQTQHLEFTRDIAERMNTKFGDLFTIPKPVRQQHEFFGKDQGLRIRDLGDPTKKMSKSDETGKGVIFLTDTPDEARKKVMSAATDSFDDVQYDYKERPGISNLLDIHKLLGGNPDEFIGQKQYGPLKTAAADRVCDFLTNFQQNLSEVRDDAINGKLAACEAAINEQANTTLLKVQTAVGLR